MRDLRRRCNGLAETQGNRGQCHLAESGQGIILAAEGTVEDGLREKKLIKFGEFPGVTEQIWLSAASRFLENPISSKMMESFKVEPAD